MGLLDPNRFTARLKLQLVIVLALSRTARSSNKKAAKELGITGQIQAVLDFNVTCAMPMEENTSFNETEIGRTSLNWMMNQLQDRPDTEPQELAENYCGLACEMTKEHSCEMQQQMCLAQADSMDKDCDTNPIPHLCHQAAQMLRERCDVCPPMECEDEHLEMCLAEMTAKIKERSKVYKVCKEFSDADIRRFCRHILPGEFCAIVARHPEVPSAASTYCILCNGSASEGDKLVALRVDCPPGFYCPGKTEQPRACKKGFKCGWKADHFEGCPRGSFCPVAGAVMECNDSKSAMYKGTMCVPNRNNRTVSPLPCPKGEYCQNGINKTCTQGHYCPTGAAEPVPCTKWESCPEKSGRPGRFKYAFVVVGISFSIVGAAIATLKQWCLPPSLIYVRIVLCFVMLASLWAYEHYTGDVGLGPTAYFTLLFDTVVWGLISARLRTSGHWFLQTRLLDLIVFVAQCLVISLFVGDLAVCAFICLLIPTSAAVKEVFGSEGYSVQHKLISTGVCYAINLLVLAIYNSPYVLLFYIGIAGVVGLDFLLRFIRKSFLTRTPAVAPQGLEMSQVMLDAEQLPDVTVQHSEAEFNNQPRPGKPGVGIEFRNVNLKLPNGQTILDDISLRIPPNGSVAIMGPSGCGKSSVTNVLSGRAGYGVVTGTVMINGALDVGIRDLYRVTGFVPQDDVMHRNLTVEEVVTFQAQLRMPLMGINNRGARGAEIAEEVTKILGMLGLADTALRTTLIGDESTRGVSGGQRKRVSIAMELMAKPSLLFLDEPTSGLDSTTSHTVVEIITRLAQELSCTTMAVIHQPRYETLMCFDRVVLLAPGGMLVYSGPTEDAHTYFADVLRVKFPEKANPADTFLDAITHESASVMAEKGTIDAQLLEVKDKTEFGKGLAVRWKDQGASSFGRVAGAFMRVPMPELTFDKCSWGEEIAVQLQRAAMQVQREWQSVVYNNILQMFGLLMLCLGSPPTKLMDEFMHPCLALFLVMLCQGVAAQRIFGGPERPVAWRECGTSVSPVLYFIGRDMTAMVEILIGSLTFVLVYWPLGALIFDMHWMIWVGFAFIYVVWGMNYITSVTMNSGSAQMMAVVMAFCCFLFGGVQPSFRVLLESGGSNGVYLMALSPVRWAYGILQCRHIVGEPSPFSNKMIQYLTLEHQANYGMPLKWISMTGWSCDNPEAGGVGKTVMDRWMGKDPEGDDDNDLPLNSFVCSTKQLFLLGTFYRFVALVLILITAGPRSRGGGRAIQDSSTEVVPKSRLLRHSIVAVFVLVTHVEMDILLNTT